MKELLKTILNQCSPYIAQGAVASYIPELAKAEKTEFAGDFDKGFTMQSIVKPIILLMAPGRMGIGIYSPALDKKGNSVAGIKALELLSRELELSIF